MALSYSRPSGCWNVEFIEIYKKKFLSHRYKLALEHSFFFVPKSIVLTLGNKEIYCSNSIQKKGKEKVSQLNKSL